MRGAPSLALLVAIGLAAGPARADPQPWSVDIAYRGTASFRAAGDLDVGVVYASSIIGRIEHTTGRWIIGAVLGTGVPGVQGQGESSVSGGVRQVLRDGVCLRGPSTELHCGPTLRLDYALDLGVTMATRITSDADHGVQYYGPSARPRVTFRASWPTRSGRQLGLTATLGVATVFGANLAMEDAKRTSTLRVEPSLELGGVLRF